MKCRRARNLIFACLDGTADESVRGDLEQHLAACENCERLAAELSRSLELVHRAPSVKLDENFNWKVRLAIHKERNAASGGASSWRETFHAWNLRYAVSAAAAFAVVVAAGWMMFDLSPLAIGSAVVGKTAPAPRTETVAREGTAFRPTTGPVFAGRSQGELVSLPSGPRSVSTTQATEPGAISATPSVVDMDSLVRSELSTMTYEQGVAYLQSRLQLFQKNLQQYQKRGPQPK